MSGKVASDSLSTLLALDIGSSFVKCILARPLEYSKKGITDGKLRLLGFSKAPQAPGNMQNGGIANISGVVSTCEAALSELEEKTGERAKSVVVGLSGELVKSSVSTIRYRRDSPKKPMTETELRELLEKIEARSKEKALKEAALELDNPDADLSLINSALVSLSIDGYRVNNPVGFKGSEAIIEYYTAFAPTVAVSAIEKVCAELELDLLTLATEPFAVCRACLGEDTDPDFSAILLDVGGGTTDLAVVSDGEIAGTKMFNFGGENFTHVISETLNVRPTTAEKYKVNLEDESLLSDSLINKTVSALNRSLPVWLGGVSVALEEFHNVLPLPPNILLAGGSSSLFPLEELLATSDWYQELPFETRPLVRQLDPFELPDFLFPDDSEENLDFDRGFVTALGLLRVAVDTLLASPEKSNLKTKLAKLLAH
ncbi:rod shape-determining protein [Candidatus Saccharibacteria bacterium]|nr:rod shape-determining protein [Candidatus Saccharibacteria bacterium]